MNYVLNALDHVRIPLGTRQAPGRNCEHIRRSGKFNFQAGEERQFYIDGTDRDREPTTVICKFHEDYAETCVPAATRIDLDRNMKKKKTSVWFVEHVTNKEIQFKIDPAQLKALQMTHAFATQTIKFTCLNVNTQGFKFLTDSEDSEHIDTSSPRFKAKTFIKNKVENCKMDNTVGESSYTIEASRTTVLPVRDILVYDVGDVNQKLGVDIGPVCFSNKK